jgi:hypothetical protein
MKKVNATEIGGEVPTNGAEQSLELSKPYVVTVTLTGTADFLFHRYNPESVKAKGEAAKGSKAKKSDDIETYVYRNDAGELCIPGEYVRQSILHAAKFRAQAVFRYGRNVTREVEKEIESRKVQQP